MPWHVEKRQGKFVVIKDATGEVVSTHPSKSQADARVRALYAFEEKDE